MGRAGAMRRARAWAKHRGKRLFTVVWQMSLLGPRRFFFLLRVVLGHFFGVFPSVPIVTPKMPGVVIIKGPLTARKKKIMSPRALFWPFLPFLAYCGSRAVPITGIW